MNRVSLETVRLAGADLRPLVPGLNVEMPSTPRDVKGLLAASIRDGRRAWRRSNEERIPERMRAVRFHRYGEPEMLELEEMPAPRPGAARADRKDRARPVTPRSETRPDYDRYGHDRCVLHWLVRVSIALPFNASSPAYASSANGPLTGGWLD